METTRKFGDLRFNNIRDLSDQLLAKARTFSSPFMSLPTDTDSDSDDLSSLSKSSDLPEQMHVLKRNGGGLKHLRRMNNFESESSDNEKKNCENVQVFLYV